MKLTKEQLAQNIRAFKNEPIMTEPKNMLSLETQIQALDFENAVLFRDTKGLIVDLTPQETTNPDEIDERRRFALTINSNIQSMYGYTLDPKIIEALASTDTLTQMAWFRQANDTLRKELNVERWEQSHLFYPNFPEEVMSKSDAELYVNAMIHYTGSILFGIDLSREMSDAGLVDAEENHKPLTEIEKLCQKSFKTISYKTHDDFHALMKDRIHGIAMSEAKQADLWTYASYFTPQYLSAVKGEYNSKENEALVAAHLYLHGHGDLVQKNGMCKDAKDILRFINVVSGKNGAEYSKATHQPQKLNSEREFDVRLDKNDKRFVKELINKSAHIYTDIWKKDQNKLWKKVMRNIDAKKAPERVVKLFDNLATKTKQDELGRSVQNPLFVAKEALKQGDLVPMTNFIHSYPGLALQNAVGIMNLTHNSNEALALGNEMKESFHACDVMSLLKARNYVDSRDSIDNRVVRNANGQLMEIQNPAHPLESYKKSILQNVLDASIGAAVSGTKELGNVYIDPALYDIKAPQRDDSNLSKGNVYSKGSMIAGNEEKNLILLGISWKNGTNGRTDIDLHASIEYKDGTKSDVGYYNLRLMNKNGDYIGLHSGDYTTGDPYKDGKGAQECIILDKNLLKESDIRYVTVYIHNFNGSTLDPSQEIRSVYMEREGRLDDCESGTKLDRPVMAGKVIEPSEFEQQIDVISPSSNVVTMSYDVENDKYIMIDEPSTATELKGRSLKNVYGAGAIQIARNFVLQSPNPTLGQLFESYALENGTIISDLSNADTIFSVANLDENDARIVKEDVRVITAFDQELIANEFCVNQDKFGNYGLEPVGGGGDLEPDEFDTEFGFEP